MSLRIAVIGVGYLGRHHARILSDLPGVELVAVVDTNRARAGETPEARKTPPPGGCPAAVVAPNRAGAEEIAEARKTRPLVDYREVVGKVDAVTIAVPT